MQFGYLGSASLDNKGLSLDELSVAAVLMLERTAPALVFSDKAGLAALFDFVAEVRVGFLSLFVFKGLYIVILSRFDVGYKYVHCDVTCHVESAGGIFRVDLVYVM
jgi:hypothetical protein